MSLQPANALNGLDTVDGALVWKTTRDGVPSVRRLDDLSDVYLLNIHRFASQNAHPADHVATLLSALTARGLTPLPDGDSHAR